MLYTSFFFSSFYGVAKKQDLFQKCSQHDKVSVSSVCCHTSPSIINTPVQFLGRVTAPVWWRSWITQEITNFVKVNGESGTEMEPRVFYSVMSLLYPFLCLLLSWVCWSPCSIWTPVKDLDNSTWEPCFKNILSLNVLV